MKVITKKGLFEYDSLEMEIYWDDNPVMDPVMDTKYEVGFYRNRRAIHIEIFKSELEAKKFIMRVAGADDRPYIIDDEMLNIDPYE